MIRATKGHYGYTILEGVEVCVEIGGEDLVLTGRVELPPVVDHTTFVDWQITAARLDRAGPCEARDVRRLYWRIGDKLEATIHDKFVEAALDAVMRDEVA